MIPTGLPRPLASAMGLFIFALALFLSTALPPAAYAVTYYIDFQDGLDSNSGSKALPWKRHPGMKGFQGSYSHQSGDRFVLKGGVTWPAATLPLRIISNGSAGALDEYTTEHDWFVGAAWTPPVLDGEGGAANAITASAKSFFLLNELKIIGIDQPQNANTKKAIDLADCHHFTIQGLTLQPEAWIGIYIYTVTPGAYGQIKVIGNEISSVATGVVVATAVASSIITDVEVANNNFHDFTSQIGGGAHGDGVHIWGRNSDDSQFVQNLRIHGNKFHGDFQRSFGTSGGMTAFIFIENATSNALIYNNSGSFVDAPVRPFGSLIALSGNPGRGGGHQVYNNSFRGTPNGMSAGIILGNGAADRVPGCIVKNNIFYGMQQVYLIGSGSEPGLQIDYNLFSSTTNIAYYLGGFRSLSQWKLLGFDTHGFNDDPMFYNTPELHLQPGSPARGQGANLFSIFTNDQGNYTRPASGPWDMGAFQYNPVLTPVTLSRFAAD